MTYIEAALHRALIRTSRRADLSSKEAVPILLRELHDGEGITLKERPVKAKKVAR